jgi:hypothetical protein
VALVSSDFTEINMVRVLDNQQKSHLKKKKKKKKDKVLIILQICE